MTKIRTSFVTNSSSSSFILQKKNLSESQLEKVRNHIEYVIAKGLDFYASSWDKWTIEETDEEIKGHTTMDNFDMEEFLKYIGVDESDFKFEKDG